MRATMAAAWPFQACLTALVLATATAQGINTFSMSSPTTADKYAAGEAGLNRITVEWASTAAPAVSTGYYGDSDQIEIGIYGKVNT